MIQLEMFYIIHKLKEYLCYSLAFKRYIYNMLIIY